MELNINEVARTGNRILKYKLNVAGTHHFICYEVKGLFFSYILLKGVLVDRNNREITNQTLKGSRKKGKYFDEYYNSSLNEWFGLKTKKELQINY